MALADRLVGLWTYLWNFRYLPIKYSWPLIKLRRRLLPTGTRLALRATARRAQGLRYPPRPYPYLFVLGLLWPFPSWSFPAELPLPPRAILAAPEAVECQWRDLMLLRTMPLWELRDTPQRSFYRLYEAFCAGQNNMMSLEMEYFWHHEDPRWATKNIPDPKCEDPEQYAVMASLAEMITKACNWRLEIGLRRNGNVLGPGVDMPEQVERYPTWTTRVPALQEELRIHAESDAQPHNPFDERNIVASIGDFYTV